MLLVRHGRTTANASGTLAGWTPGIGLDEVGRAQAQSLAERLAAVPLAAVVTSPLERCQETVSELVAVPGPKGAARPAPLIDDRLGEARYGDWTGPRAQGARQGPALARRPGTPVGGDVPG